ncbi:SPARC-related modular calcium-binding protein 2 [Anopheles ziemanni]|uniref:SPARC-related modular calcium-binding protein 2 n=1 Tax=Anopheles coustani TaxID=139045 RepID=UPI0026595F1E|nr:SPARC-related modular calcium-binding protein 2 [Anopheles coustani]XP_058178916.1 SPARC-related modular calcium-binding protein 2 [Anopheles ziemanni]
MWMTSVCCLAMCVLLAGSFQSAAAITPKSEPTISECAAKGGECDESKGRPVCGSDNKTYPTRCHLIRAQCSGHQVTFKHRGSCKDVCIASRTYALQQRANAPYTIKYVPRCREDGTYAPVQCIDGGGCWCVNGQGKQLPNTMVQHGKPICVKKGKSNQRRSSPRNPIRNKRSCSGIDRAVFNTNLLKLFQNEHVRVNQHNLTGPINERTVLDWKFNMMDLNGNDLLDKTEYRTMKRLIKKVVKPKRCGRSFGKNCDADQDDRLSRNEWYNCLAKDDVTHHNPSSPSSSSSPIASSSSGGSGGHYTVPQHQQQHPQQHHHHQHHHHPSTIGGLQVRGSVGGGGGVRGGGGHFLRADDDGDSQNLSNDFTDDDDDDHSENEYDSDELPDSDNALLNGLQLPVNGLQPYLLLQGPTMVDPKGEDDNIFKDSEADSDCLSDRKYALDEQKYGTNALYVPECTADGRYQRIQCYRSTGYCWCVNEDTGKNIPGTSTKDEKPVCDQYASSARPMKGCPEEKKVEFLKDLKAFLSKQVTTSFAGKIIPVWNTEEEKIAILSFVLLDKNQNKQLERKEWKAFRELVTSTRQLRKCGKKMPRYCDVNSDRKITLSEWMSCLDGKRNSSVDVAAMSAPLVQAEAKAPGRSGSPAPAATSSKFKGQNPLEFVLKSD